MPTKKIIKEYEDVALSNYDILKLVNHKAKIVLYPNLHKFKTIDQILGPYGACIILFEAKPNYGHWCCLFKVDDNILEFFNPYGGYPDDTLEYIPISFRKISHQCKPYLSFLLYNSPYELTYNEFQFQQHKPNIRTCGRHCVMRILCRNLSLYDYVKFLDLLCQKFNMNYDEVVTLITLKI
jgi:hypothetical protein